MLDLVPQSGVRVADVPGRAGSSRSSSATTGPRVVTISVNGDVELPANAVAAIQQSSLLGEKYVELAAAGQRGAPGHAWRTARGSRSSGPTATSRSRSCSARCRWCSTAAGWPSCRPSTGSSATRSRAARPRSRTRSTSSTPSSVGSTQQKDGDQPGAGQRRTRSPPPWPPARRRSRTALDTIGPGLDVINEQRDLLVSMLEGLARLGDVGTRIINQSAANTIADLQLLQPILTQLAAAGPEPRRLAGAAAQLPVPRQLPVGAELPRGADRWVWRCSPT